MTSKEIRYTDDVKESLGLARRIAKKSTGGIMQDWQVLQGVLLTRRKFNRVDSLLNALQSPAQRLRQELESAVQSLNGKASTNTTEEESLRLISQAEAMAQSETSGTPKRPTVEVEHLLKALAQSEDPVVQSIMAAHQITPERVDQALVDVNRAQGRHSLLFIGKELAEVIVFVLFFLILIKSFLGELRLIPSESMVPLLKVEDRLVIERLSRLYRPYQRGDVLVFYPPQTTLKNDPWSLFLRATGFSGLMYKKEDNVDVAYIKRLVGLPGDTVDVRRGEGVFVNGEKLDEPYVADIARSCTLEPTPEPLLGVMQQEHLPYHNEQLCEPIRVPPGKYFMMGDNRNQSLDSRYWGFADQDRVIGRAVFRIWPPNRVGPLPPPPYQAH